MAILSVINSFSPESGHKVNLNKSVAMPVGGATDPLTIPNFPFKWSTSGLTYLGITVSPNLHDLFKLNFGTVLSKVKCDMDRWLHLPLSWIGRVNLVKMNILPRLLYPMQMIPLWITRKIVKSFERDLSKFIWHDKKPRLKMKTLQLPVDRGGG